MADTTNDVLPTVAQSGFTSSWDWKGSYMSPLKEDGYERFSQFSASPDSTALFAGPARYTGMDSSTDLIPIGLVDNIGYQTNAQLIRLFEIGSNRSFFTRGKSAPTISMTKVLADQQNILAALSRSAYRPPMASDGMRGPGAEGSDIMMNLDSEFFAVPFGLLLVMKTRGGNSDGYGKALSALYLEYCMFSGYSFQIASQQPIIAENINIEFDRPVPVNFG
jgi:hypothetical protein